MPPAIFLTYTIYWMVPVYKLSTAQNRITYSTLARIQKQKNFDFRKLSILSSFY